MFSPIACTATRNALTAKSRSKKTGLLNAPDERTIEQPFFTDKLPVNQGGTQNP
jgi:hypothetical protein